MKQRETYFSGIVVANRQVSKQNASEICSAAENDLVEYEKYDQRAESNAIGWENSAEDGDQEAVLLDKQVSKNIQITPEDDDQKFHRKTSLWRWDDTPPENDEQTVAGDKLVMHSENSNSERVSAKLVWQANRSFAGVARKQAEGIKSYRSVFFVLETKLAKKRDTIKDNEAFIKKLADGVLPEKTTSKTLMMKVQERIKPAWSL